MSEQEEKIERIENLDREIVKLLHQRASFFSEWARSKDAGVPDIFDPSKSQKYIDKIMIDPNGEFPHGHLCRIMNEINASCVNMTRPIKIGYLGPEGTYTHQAALNVFGTASNFIPARTPDDLFDAVEKGQMDYSCVAIENSTGGVVHSVLDRFLNSDVKINSEYILYIHHCLISNLPMSEIKRVFSHPQPFLQCGRWLRQYLPNAKLVEASSTVEGVRLAKESTDGAAISSELAAKLNGMNIVASDIQDNTENYTRFVIIGKTLSEPTGNDKTSVILSLKHKPGSLFGALQPFATRSINLTKIESRPTRQRPWEYVFFIDFEGHANDKIVQKVLEELEPNTIFVKILGSYPRFKSNE